MNRRIIVTLTSWPGRIKNVATVLETILKQTTPPDLIEINLSLLEFPNKEKDLPNDLQELIEKNKQIEINWCEDNTYTFKKLIPTLKKFLGENYYLVSIDDDLLFKENFIEKSIDELEKLGVSAFNFSSSQILGNRQIYKSEIFDKDFWENLTQKFIDSRHDDGYIFYYLKHLKNVRFSCHPTREKMFSVYNPVLPTNRAVKYVPFSEIHKLL